MSHAMLLRVFEFIGEQHIEFTVYAFFYDNYRLFDLDPKSLFVWTAAMLGTDHGYYWAHRFLHETNIGWSSHQVHHSSEDFNLSTGVRQSLFQKYYCWPFYIPMALAGIPTSLFMIHMGIALIYQFWIHTELISSLGPFDYIMNVPGHHQIHHGRNSSCIDKNYAGVFIIWDRIYGTFADPASINEPIAYGLVGGTDSFGFLSIQFKYYRHLIKQVQGGYKNGRSIKDQLKKIFYGPGYNFKKPEFRLGDPADLPKPSFKLFDPPTMILSGSYMLVQLLSATAVMSHFLEIQSKYSNVPDHSKYDSLTCLPIIIWLFWTSVNIGIINDAKFFSFNSELIRTWSTALISANGGLNQEIPFLRNLFPVALPSAILYSVYFIKSRVSDRRSKNE